MRPKADSVKRKNEKIEKDLKEKGQELRETLPFTEAFDKAFSLSAAEAEEYLLEEGEERSYLDPVAKQVRKETMILKKLYFLSNSTEM